MHPLLLNRPDLDVTKLHLLETSLMMYCSQNASDSTREISWNQCVEFILVLVACSRKRQIYIPANCARWSGPEHDSPSYIQIFPEYAQFCWVWHTACESLIFCMSHMLKCESNAVSLPLLLVAQLLPYHIAQANWAHLPSLSQLSSAAWVLIMWFKVLPNI